MRHETIETGELSYSPCRYGNSRMLFRGPRKRLDLPYLAFIGGTETYGKFIEKPFPTLVEKAMRQTCVNFGCVNGGIDAFVNDPTIMDICAEADLTVVQVMGANYLSNRFYSVHPRRNDRFLRASTVLQAIYQEIDFSEFSFTRHMLNTLHATSLERFETVVIELRAAWLARMRNMLGQIGRRSILLWFSEDAMTDKHWADRPGQLQVDPLFITASMIDELRPLVKDVVVVNPTQRALSRGSRGMFFPTSQAKAASEMLGVDCHVEASAALIQSIRNQLYAL
ncbi:hypothetical protein SAMN05421665_3300 [Yoonia rosea]|uniref:DUF6473 domain-containing protein n=1 Tax=Yoonia rosea TaxID=287098 RepID=A0A1R3XHQ6_9RHOB|nr:DUF6473 family protein [Yoonia rosea]SIT91002.1 hypothetical protein SAMN05421665_3300 [Yoonia rosea]